MNLNIPFAEGLDLKTDPKQVTPGKFLALSNSVFTKGGLLTKRNGYESLTNIDADYLNTLTTFNGNLTAIGQSLYAYSQDTEQWINKGDIVPVSLSTLSLVRSSSEQETVDVSVLENGLTCTVWEDSIGTSNYQVIDSTTGQVIVPSTALQTGAEVPRVFNLGRYFVITYLINITGTIHLRYISIVTNDITMVSAPVDLSTQVALITSAYDGQIISGQLYIAWDGSDGGGAVRITKLDQYLNQGATVALAGQNAEIISICGDLTGVSPTVWLSYKDSTDDGYSANFTSNLGALLATTQIWNNIDAVNLTSFAQNSINTVYYQTLNNYSYAAIRSDFMSSVTITSLGVVGSPIIILRSVALASKAFMINGVVYMLVTYGSDLQPTYFLIDSEGNIVAKLAYSNGGGYPSNQILSNAIVYGTVVNIGYLFKGNLTAVNKEQTGTVGGIYSQTGINLASFDLASEAMVSSEIGGSLHFASGFLWMYDGVKPVEHGFHVWPDNLLATTSTLGGFLTAQQYFYQVTYEWTDSQGNIHRSAPSLPLDVDLSASATSTNSVTLNIPTLRLTYKTAPNSVRILIYRWSTTNQQYYQITSIQSPTLNNPAVDSIAYVDTLADTSIIGNALIYTTGGVIENIGAPSSPGITLFKSRLFLIDSENRNLIWYSKQVIQNTPVEMSDLLTVFVAPTTGAQGSTGDCTVLSAMDDKLIIFKAGAIYYMTGTGPDNTGASNDFTDPIFITATVGCTNPQSVTFMPNGIMFQSDKGIWLLGRDLSTTYIGAAVEDFNTSVVNSALTIPATNQCRFTLDTGQTLMYDYYFGQWGTFTNVPAISSTIYQDQHTFLNIYGAILQESEGLYLDGSKPVLLSFTTGWMNLAGLQGYIRAYSFYLEAEYITPHKLQIQIAYDYNSYPSQSSIILPDNFTPNYGGDSLYVTTSPYGGPGTDERWRVFLEKQKCEAFQIILNEVYDGTYGVPAGAGFTLSGIDMLVGVKSRYPRLNPARSVG